MERTDLRMSGEPLHTVINLQNRNVTQYYTVQYAGYPVGVGLYHNHNDTCTFALVLDETGERRMLGRLSKDFPFEVDELHFLEAYFAHMFSS